MGAKHETSAKSRTLTEPQRETQGADEAGLDTRTRWPPLGQKQHCICAEPPPGAIGRRKSASPPEGGSPGFCVRAVGFGACGKGTGQAQCENYECPLQPSAFE